MKTKVFFACFVFCFAWQAKAQTTNNTIVNDNSSWAVLHYNPYPLMEELPTYVGTSYIYFEGDSVFNDLIYKKVYSSDRLHEKGGYNGLIRENDKKTYFIPKNSNEECLIYDFSLEHGTLYEDYSLESGYSMGPLLVGVDSIDINGSLKKRIRFSLLNEQIVETWIEGVGSLSGILYPTSGWFYSGGKSDLLCYYQYNDLIYKNYLPECYYDNLEDLRRDFVTPLFESGNQWNELGENHSLPPEYQYQKTYITRIGSEITINGYKYKELLTARDEQSDIWLVSGYIRETIDVVYKTHQVLYRATVNAPEIVLYDFFANVGDKIQSRDLQQNIDVEITVKAVDHVLINGKFRRRMKVCSTDIIHDVTYSKDHIWIRGIGNIDGFLQSTMTIKAPGSESISLLCFSKNDELIYKPENTNIEDCFVWRTPFNDVHYVNDNSISVYPNPVNDILTISSSSNQILRVEIFNVSGQKVYSENLKNNQKEITVNFLVEGLYFIQIQENNGQINNFKIVKK